MKESGERETSKMSANGIAKPETNAELGDKLILLAYNAHVIHGHIKKLREKLTGVKDTEIVARCEASPSP